MKRIRPGVLLVLLGGVAGIFILGVIGERLGDWTDRQPQGVVTVVWLAWDLLLLGIGISIIVVWRRRRGSGNSH